MDCLEGQIKRHILVPQESAKVWKGGGGGKHNCCFNFMSIIRQIRPLSDKKKINQIEQKKRYSTWNVEPLVFNTDGVGAFHLWGEHHSVVEVLLVHDLAQFSRTLGIRHRGLHIEWISSYRKYGSQLPFNFWDDIALFCKSFICRKFNYIFSVLLKPKHMLVLVSCDSGFFANRSYAILPKF